MNIPRMSASYSFCAPCLTLEVDGEQEEQAIKALVNLLSVIFEEYTHLFIGSINEVSKEVCCSCSIPLCLLGTDFQTRTC